MPFLNRSGAAITSAWLTNVEYLYLLDNHFIKDDKHNGNAYWNTYIREEAKKGIIYSMTVHFNFLKASNPYIEKYLI